MVFPFSKKCKYNEGMYTWQDFIEINNESDLRAFVLKVIDSHKGSSLYKYAKEADLYDKQKNVTINEYTKKIYKLSGEPVVDFTSTVMSGPTPVVNFSNGDVFDSEISPNEETFV